jgi:type IV pilus assembly protein PilB
VRLTEMGIEPFLVGSALDCVLAQRLARRLCAKCKEPYTPSKQALLENGFPWEDGMELPTLHRPIGCSACSKTGYKGRLALHEVMAVTEEIEKLTVERASSMSINRMAIEQGMITLRKDGLLKVIAGVTSVEEIFRVVA